MGAGEQSVYMKEGTVISETLSNSIFFSVINYSLNDDVTTKEN